jgi:hypothetical protein
VGIPLNIPRSGRFPPNLPPTTCHLHPKSATTASESALSRNCHRSPPPSGSVRALTASVTFRGPLAPTNSAAESSSIGAGPPNLPPMIRHIRDCPREVAAAACECESALFRILRRRPAAHCEICQHCSRVCLTRTALPHPSRQRVHVWVGWSRMCLQTS